MASRERRQRVSDSPAEPVDREAPADIREVAPAS